MHDTRRLLRDDMAFNLTYYLGRKGLLSTSQVVGHPESALQVSSMTSSRAGASSFATWQQDNDEWMDGVGATEGASTCMFR